MSVKKTDRVQMMYCIVLYLFNNSDIVHLRNTRP